MTGSYFRGDAVPVMRPEDEAMFQPTINYNYYQQLNGYKWLKSLGIGYSFFQGKLSYRNSRRSRYSQENTYPYSTPQQQDRGVYE